MPRRVVVFLLPLLLPSLLNAKDATLPMLVVAAQYVQVTTYFGDEPANTRIVPDDRHALADVERAIKKWGRYKVVYRPQDADLIIVVRKGRYADIGIGIHAKSAETGPAVGPRANAEVGDPLDTLIVYDASHGIDSPPLWRGRQRNGLEPPHMELVKELRTKVETAEAAAKKP